jgi:hypothetical protein
LLYNNRAAKGPEYKQLEYRDVWPQTAFSAQARYRCLETFVQSVDRFQLLFPHAQQINNVLDIRISSQGLLVFASKARFSILDAQNINK